MPQSRLSDEPWKHDEGLLKEKWQWLVGKRLFEIDPSVREIDKASRVKTKGMAAYVIEKYFGIGRNSRAEPDFKELEIELKTVPLNSKNGMLTVKEPMSLNMIDYTAERDKNDISESSLYVKNRRLLLVCYADDPRTRSESQVHYAFLWEMNKTDLEDLRPDFNAIIQKIRDGKADELHQNDGNRFLTTCPKHGGHKNRPEDDKWMRKQPGSPVMAEKRAYRLKSAYMCRVISRHVGLPLGKSGPRSGPNWWLDEAHRHRDVRG